MNADGATPPHGMNAEMAAPDEARSRSWSRDSAESSILSDASTVPDAATPGTTADLTLLHACVHCRASKTACSDCRPCLRCQRLGLNW